MKSIKRGESGYSNYKVELDGKFLRWDDVWIASEENGYVEKIVTQPEFDVFGNIVTPPFTRRTYGRVFIVRVMD